MPKTLAITIMCIEISALKLNENSNKNKKGIIIKSIEGYQLTKDINKNAYNLDYNQIQESYQTLKEYGNLTGVSLPTVLGKAMTQKNSMIGKSLLVGITMGFGLDIVEIEKT